MQVSFRTDTGLVRPSNQDSCACGSFSENAAWAVVCDGVGGAHGGEVASALAAKVVRETLEEGFSPELERQSIRTLILNAVGKANAAVYGAAQEDAALQGMGTTVVVLLAADGYLHVAHVGDSRAYLKRAGGLAPITVDHSFVQDLVSFGQITPEEARVHPQRNIITRALGIHEEVQCDYSCFDFSPGDLAMACTDGLTMYAEDGVLLKTMEEHDGDPDGLVEALVDLALESGGADNVTVAVISDHRE